MECRCSLKALRVILLHFKVDKMNRGVIKKEKKKGNIHSGKPRKSLDKPGFPGIPGKFSSLLPGRCDIDFYSHQS
jgi:hypothetical protein